MQSYDYIVTLPPPTPNGGLHVGHLAGPFLSADIFAKAAQQRGNSVYVLSYSDSNQSYVRATAEKQNCSPRELSAHCTKDILETLDIYGCQVDHYFEPNSDSNGFVRDTILRLFEAGVLSKRKYPFFYSLDREEYLDEAGVSGFCPRCLDNSKCGICEACGFTTQANTMIAPYATNNRSEAIEVREVEVIMLDLEASRDFIRNFHRFPDSIRPKYRWLVDDVLREVMPSYPVTVPGSWGIKIDHPEFPNQVINAWSEIAFDFVYGYDLAGGSGRPAKIVNFFGYDNSYFYAFVHIALFHLADLEKYLPTSTLINEFYNLQNSKFSTSRGHLIWARDLAKEVEPDLIRFFLALTCPGFEQGNFNREDLEEVLQRRLLEPYCEIVEKSSTLSVWPDGEPCKQASRIANILEQRVSRSMTLERFNLRHAAEDSLKGLEAILHGLDSKLFSLSDVHLILKT